MPNRSRLSHALAVAIIFLAGPAFGLGQQISSLTVSPNPVAGGEAAVGTVKLTKAAGVKGLKITLSSSQKAAEVPASVTIASGSTTATFAVSTSAVTEATKATIKGEDPTGKSADETLEIALPTVRLTELSMSPATVAASKTSTGTVTLSADAPSEGFVVKLSTTATSISIPASVTVGSGAKTATFTIETHIVTAASTATIKAIDGDGFAASAKVVVDLPAVRLTAIKVLPATVTAANPATATITLSEDAPAGGFSVNLTTAQSFITVPASVSVKAGAKTATFTVLTSPVATAGAATISSTDPSGYSAEAKFSVEIPKVRLTGMSISPASVTSGVSATGTVALSAAAPAAGFVVNLSTMQSFVSIPMNVKVKAGSTSATFTISSGAVTTSSTATILAADVDDYRATAPVIVNPNVSGSAVTMTNAYTFSPQTITVAAGSVVTWTNGSAFMAHTVTSDVANSGMNSGGQYPNDVPPGMSYSWVVPATAKSGTAYYYHCMLHGTAGNGTSLGTGMVGVVIVK